jgi:hypothetical protein
LAFNPNPNPNSNPYSIAHIQVQVQYEPDVTVIGGVLIMKVIPVFGLVKLCPWLRGNAVVT